MYDEGINCRDGHITVDSFVKYRHLIEPQYPLANELHLLHLPILPQPLVQWQLIKTLVHETLTSMHKDVNYHRLHIEQVQYILHNAGMHYSRIEIYRLMLHRAYFDQLMKHLLLKSLKGNYSTAAAQEHTQLLERGVLVHVGIDGITVDDLTTVAVKSFYGWCCALSRVPPSTTNVPHITLATACQTIY